jgi:5-methylcytosine-specific restriction endonuclease McrA
MTAFIAVARTKRNPEGRGNQCRLCRNKAINARYAVRVAEDPDSVHTQQAQWRHNNPEAQTKARRNWEKNHPEKSAAKRMRRRALLANAPIVENVSPDVIFRRDKGICGLCGKRVKKADISIDHVIPLSCGGAHSKQNCVLAHQRCNSAKNNKAVPQQQRLFG